MTHNPEPDRIDDGCCRLHIGSMIAEELRRQNRPAAWLAQAICCDRTNIYKILRKASIDTDLLCRICVALNYDFFAEFQAVCGFSPKPSVSKK